MGGLGGFSPFPLPMGGGPSGAEIIYRVLRAAVGGDSGAGPVGGVEDSWRWVKAQAIWAGMESFERAVLQALPQFATDHVEVYESLLNIAEEETLVERVVAITAAFCLQLAVDIPSLKEDLRRIDPALSVVSPSYDLAKISHFGKAFGPRPGTSGPPYGSGVTAGVNSTKLPNFSTTYIVRVIYTLSSGQTTIPYAVIDSASRHLCKALPSWVDFNLTARSASGSVGFFLDGGSDGTSLLDSTAFR